MASLFNAHALTMVFLAFCLLHNVGKFGCLLVLRLNVQSAILVMSGQRHCFLCITRTLGE